MNMIRNYTRYAAGIMLFVALISVSGCRPTYPKERIKESIIKLCKDEYKLDVKVDAAGKTIAIYLELPNLIDLTFGLTKSASEKINDVIMSVSRVATSSDADYQFYCVIAHDARIPELQIVVIKSVDDVKRFWLNDISRDEYFKRMIIDMRLSPQAQKERSVQEVFERMGIDKKWQEQVLNDFFRSEPTGLGEIGYWNDRFYVKDVSLPEFLAEQMASRVRLEFREDKQLNNFFVLKSSKGIYGTADNGKTYFRLDIFAGLKYYELPKDGVNYQYIALEAVLKVAAAVTHNYNFTNFSYVEIVDAGAGQLVRVTKEDLERFRRHKAKFEDIIEKDTVH